MAVAHDPPLSQPGGGGLLGEESMGKTVSDPMRSPGVHGRTLDLPSGERLRYTIAIPDVYAGSRAAPLILALHYGWSGTQEPPPFYGKGLILDLVGPALAELEAILLAPDCLQQDWTHPESESAVLALLDWAAQTYAIDADRIVITGYSLGAAGTWHLAVRHGERFSAAIPISGWCPQEALPETQLPLYVIHSREDEVFRFEHTESVVQQLRERGRRVEFVTVDGITHFETWRFAEVLRQALPWIRRVWGDTAG
jgi:predicted peptidase